MAHSSKDTASESNILEPSERRKNIMSGAGLKIIYQFSLGNSVTRAISYDHRSNSTAKAVDRDNC